MSIERRNGYRVWVGGPVPRGAVAITFGSLVIVRSGLEHDEHLLNHELVHVQQWQRYGAVAFAVRYLASYAKWRLCRKNHHLAYLRIPLEIEAEWVARRQSVRAPERADRPLQVLR